MAQAFTVRVSIQGSLRFDQELPGGVEMGRQEDPREEMFIAHPLDSARWRVAIAQHNENTVSRRMLRIDAPSNGMVTLSNLSEKNRIFVKGGASIAARGVVQLRLPVTLLIGEQVVIDLSEVGADLPALHTLGQATVFLGTPSVSIYASAAEALAKLSPQATESLIGWWKNVIAVLQSAANSTDFFQRAAEGLCKLMELDAGGVLLLQGGKWKLAALSSDSERPWSPSRHVLARVHEEKRTFWQSSTPTESVSESLMSVEAVVAAPILNRGGDVIGALYGYRSQNRRSRGLPEITKLDAMLVETLACGVAAGLARLEQEQAALAAQVKFEQFFSPELSRQLASEPDLLDGRDTEVTLLVCDIRGFSRVAERLGPTGTLNWVGAVLSALSDCVANFGGVLVDYVGDELLAMWGAPSKQPDHAVLACQAAQQMLAALPTLNDTWTSIIGEDTRVGIGVNTGIARVGNTGSTRKFKYGPLGNSVNLASRVQGATKYLKSSLLITGATRAQLRGEFAVRRLCKVRVVNISQPVELFELQTNSTEVTNSLCLRYEQALDKFDRGQFRECAKMLGRLLIDFPDDGPSLVLLSRAVSVLIEERQDVPNEWELPGK